MRKAGIGIVFRNDKKEVLLIKRKDLPIFVLPGGGIEAGENPSQACEREVFEETGLSVQMTRPTGIYLPINRLTSKTYVFECIPLKDPYQPLYPQEESEEVGFYPINNLPPRTFFLHQEWIQDALQNTQEPLLKEMKSITYASCCKYILLHPILMLRYFFSRIGKA